MLVGFVWFKVVMALFDCLDCRGGAARKCRRRYDRKASIGLICAFEHIQFGRFATGKDESSAAVKYPI